LLNCILTSALKLNSRVRSRHIIVPPPLVCNNMNADGASRDRSFNTYESTGLVAGYNTPRFARRPMAQRLGIF
jgi:hypothetical protein